MIRPIIAIALAVLLLLAWAEGREAFGEEPIVASLNHIEIADMACRGVGVIDGDTLNLCGNRVRLWGIQAPERSDPEGPAATRALASIIAGREVLCGPPPTGQNRDVYGRFVRKCWIDGQDIAAEMVRQGHAMDWPKYSRGFYGSVGR